MNHSKDLRAHVDEPREQTPEQLDFPANWDRLAEPVTSTPAAPRAHDATPLMPDERGSDDSDHAARRAAPPVLSLVAAAWADLVSLLGFCTACLLAVVIAGYNVALVAMPWIAAAAVVWWSAAAAALIVVRRGTPGMLMAGVAFATRVPGRRLPAVLAVAVLQSCLLGLPAIGGPGRAPLRWASGVSLSASGAA